MAFVMKFFYLDFCLSNNKIYKFKNNKTSKTLFNSFFFSKIELFGCQKNDVAKCPITYAPPCIDSRASNFIKYKIGVSRH